MSLPSRCEGRFDRGPGCWEWTGAKDGCGYPMLWHGGGSYRAHRLVAGLERGDPRVAMHTCDNPSCVNPEHIVVGTHMDNNHDMIRKGRRVDWRRTLTEQDEDWILLMSGAMTHLEMSNVLGVTKSGVTAAKRRALARARSRK